MQKNKNTECTDECVKALPSYRIPNLDQFVSRAGHDIGDRNAFCNDRLLYTCLCVV